MQGALQAQPIQTFPKMKNVFSLIVKCAFERVLHTGLRLLIPFDGTWYLYVWRSSQMGIAKFSKNWCWRWVGMWVMCRVVCSLKSSFPCIDTTPDAYEHFVIRFQLGYSEKMWVYLLILAFLKMPKGRKKASELINSQCHQLWIMYDWISPGLRVLKNVGAPERLSAFLP